MILDGLTLPDSLKWSDEYDFNLVTQTAERTVTGGMVIQEQAKQYGRPITLTGTPDSVWVTKSDIEALLAKEALVNTDMSVTLPDGRAFNVRFDRGSGAAIKASPVSDYGIPDGSSLYTIEKIKLITVEL